MQIAYLREFIELMNCMSFNKAAEKLYISQPALSNHIAELEKEFGTALVTRDRPIKPTIAGVSLYSDACKIVEIYEGARQRCHDLEHASIKGSLTIKIPHGGGNERRKFMSIVTGFRNEYPFIEVNLTSGTHKYLLDELRSGGIDCGVVPLAQAHDALIEQNPDLEFVFSSSAPLGVWLDPTNPLASQQSVTVAQLEKCHYPLPAGAQFSELESSATAFFEQHGVTPQYRHVLAETFDEFLFGMRPNEVLLGTPNGTKSTSGALDDKVFVPFEPAIENRCYIVTLANNADPALELLREYIYKHLGD